MTLKEIKEKFKAKQDALAAVFAEAKTEDGGLDFDKVECLGDEVKGSIAVCEKVNEMNDELNSIFENELKPLQDADRAARDLKSRERALPGFVHPTPDGSGIVAPHRKSLGEQITDEALFKSWGTGQNRSEAIRVDEYGLAELKATMSTTAGWAPESTRTGHVVDDVTRPIQILDIIPTGKTGMASVVYMEETTRTHAAAEVAEAGTYAESAFAHTERSSTVRKIGDSIPVTDEQLQDVPLVQGYIDQRLRFGVRQRLDNQVLNGDGIAPNLTGILNTAGIQTQAKGADPVPDAIYKAMTLVRVTGRAVPGAVVMHPNDWQDIRLLRTADGVYIWGSPSEAGPERIWGLPVVQSDAIVENTALVGDFASFSQLVERRGIEVKMGFVDDQFKKGLQTLRADMRVALLVYRAAAFCTVTGI